MSKSSYQHVPTGQLFIFEDSVVSGLSSFVRYEVEPEEVTSLPVKAKATKSTSSKEGNK